MNDLKLKERIFKNPITTFLGIILAGGAVAVAPGDWRTNLAAAGVAIVGFLLKDPQLPSGGNPA